MAKKTSSKSTKLTLFDGEHIYGDQRPWPVQVNERLRQLFSRTALLEAEVGELRRRKAARR
jgi:hypothetical protein